MVANISITGEADTSHSSGSRDATKDVLPAEDTGEVSAQNGLVQEHAAVGSGSSASLGIERLDSDSGSSTHARVSEEGKGVEESGGEGSDRRAVKLPENKKKLPSSVELLQPAVQALAVLSNVSLNCLGWIRMALTDMHKLDAHLQVLAHFIDCVFESSEKDKVTSLLKAVLLNVWPHLHEHRYC